MSQIYKSAASGGGVVTSVTGTNGVTADPTTGAVVISGVNATTASVGVASFNPLDFSVIGGAVSLIGTTPNSYTNVTFAMSPYTVNATDYYLSVDATGGAVTINLPDSTTTNRQFIIKDRLGQSQTNHITVKSLTGASTIDGQSNYMFVDNYESLECLFHGTNYEGF